jgi:hypothetical protein
MAYERLSHSEEACEVIEAFASPFNNNLDLYCSLYPEDSEFGSIGDFFTVISTRGVGEGIVSTCRRRWVINPPFTNTIFVQVCDAISKRMNMAPEDEYYFLMPEWPSSALYALIREHGTMTKLVGGTYLIYDHINGTYISPFVDMIFGTIRGRVSLNDVCDLMKK